MPLAAHAVWLGDTLQLDAAWGQFDEALVAAAPLALVRASGALPVASMEQARAIGRRVAQQLCLGGAVRAGPLA